MLKLQTVDSISFFRLILGFVWNHLEIFDLDGHNLGTIQSNITPSGAIKKCCCKLLSEQIVQMAENFDLDGIKKLADVLDKC